MPEKNVAVQAMPQTEESKSNVRLVAPSLRRLMAVPQAVTGDLTMTSATWRSGADRLVPAADAGL